MGLIAVAAVIWFFFVRYRVPEGGSSAPYATVREDDSMKTGLSKPALIGLYLLCVAVPVGAVVAVLALCAEPGIGVTWYSSCWW